MASTVTPSAIMPSAMVAMLSAEPSAFWIVYGTPAALKASSSAGRSLDSHRTDDLVSGRITPILPFAWSPPLAALLALPPLLPLLPSLLHPDRANPAPMSTANATDPSRFMETAPNLSICCFRQHIA